MERWKTIKAFPKYEVSDEGRIRTKKTGRILVQNQNQYGVVQVGLMGDHRIQHQRSVSLLVANAFVPKKQDAFDTPICLDGDRWNNAARNLAWRPRWFAVKYNRQFVTRYHSPIDRHVRNVATGDEFPDSLECSKWYGLLESDLVLSIMNRTYVWPLYQQFEVVV